MRVRLKSTGQLGTIPDDRYDPNLFEQVGGVNPQATASVPVPQSYTPTTTVPVPAARTGTQTITESIMPALGSTLAGIGGAAVNVIPKIPGAVANFFFPRTSEYLKTGLSRQADVLEQMRQYNNSPEGQIQIDLSKPETWIDKGAEALGRARWKLAQDLKPALPIAGEIAPWLIPPAAALRAGAVSTPVQRILARGLQGVGIGATLGATKPGGALEDITQQAVISGKAPSVGQVGQMIGESAPAAIIGGIAGLAVQGGVEGAKALGRLFHKAGSGMVTQKVQPQTGERIGFARREERATEEALLKKTKGVTPRALDKELEDNLMEVGDKAAKELSGKKPVWFSLGVPPGEDKWAAANTRAYQQGVQAPLDFQSRAMMEVQDSMGDQMQSKGMKGAFERYFAPFRNRAVNVDVPPGQGQISQTINPDVLYQSRQELGRMLMKEGVWSNIRQGLAGKVTPKQWVGVQIYDTTGKVLNEITSGKFQPYMDAEKAIYAVADGISELAHRGGAQNPSFFAVYRFPIIGLFPQLLDSASILGGRLMYNVGQAMENAADPITQKYITPLLNAMLGQMNIPRSTNQQGQTTGGFKFVNGELVPDVPQEPVGVSAPAGGTPMGTQSYPVEQRAQWAQEAISTSEDPQATYNAIINDEPDLSPYLHP